MYMKKSREKSEKEKTQINDRIVVSGSGVYLKEQLKVVDDESKMQTTAPTRNPRLPAASATKPQDEEGGGRIEKIVSRKQDARKKKNHSWKKLDIGIH